MAGCSESGIEGRALEDSLRLEPGAPDDCGGAHVPIAAIQGSGASSPHRDLEVTTEGVVVGSFQGASQLGGFFVQDPVGDGDPTTSEGLFVFEGREDGVSPRRDEGDWVRVTGVVTEYYGQTQLGRVRRVTTCGRGSVPATLLQLPILDPARLEAHEGMRVRFAQPLTVVDTWGLGTYGEMWLSAGGRPRQGDEALAGEHLLLLDDGSDQRDRRPVEHLAGATTIRLGDRTSAIEGVSSFAFGSYRLQPTRPPSFEGLNARPPAPPREGLPREETLRVAALNLENYFVDLGLRGAATEEELAVQRAKLVRALLDLAPDIAGLVELQNDAGGAGEDLVASMAAELGYPAYRLVPTPRLGGDAIRVSLIYAVDRVTPLGSPIHSGDPVHPRPPLAQTFTWGERRLTVAVAHLKSRRCSGARGADLDQGDGQGCYNELRQREARSLLAFLRLAQRRAGDSALVLVGDLNAYPGEEPLGVLEGGGLRPLLLSPRLELDLAPYSYVFEGRAGLLDHLFGTPTLEAQLVGGGAWHINADEPAVLRDLVIDGERPAEGESPYRCSDHDPVYVDLSVPRTPVCTGEDSVVSPGTAVQAEP